MNTNTPAGCSVDVKIQFVFKSLIIVLHLGTKVY